MLSAFFRDARLALRSARRRPGFAAAVIGTLALAIGANTAIFTVVRTVLLRSLPFAHPERLVAVHSIEPGNDKQPIAIADFFDIVESNRSFEALIAYGGWSANLTGVDDPVSLPAQWVSRGFFRELGIRAALGRTPHPEEEQPGAPKVVLLGDGLWRSRFGADPSILGKVLRLNSEPYEVIGVLPPDFLFLTANAPQLVAPLVLETDPRRARRGSAFMRVVGRLRPGTSPEQAKRDLDAIVARLQAAYPDTNSGRSAVRLQPLAELVVGNYGKMLLVLQAAVGLVLLIACTNLANLLIARLASRRPELAVRTALGARRRDLAGQLLTETGVLALLGGLLGLGLAYGGVRLLLAFGPAALPRATEVGIDLPVLLFGVSLSLAAGLAIGVAPALQGSGRGLADGLGGIGRGNTGGPGRSRARAVLVAAEVGLSLVLLVGAGLLLRTLHRLQQTHPGFRADHLLSVRLSLPKARYGTPDAIARYAEQATARLAALPGVAAVSAASLNPLTQWKATVSFLIVGSSDQDPRKAPLANFRAVAPGHFATLEIPLLEGRDIGPQDTADSVHVAVVSRTLARRHFSGSPIGARLRIDDREPLRTVEIVGVVGDVKFTGLDAESAADVYIPYTQATQQAAVWLANIFCLAVRTRGEPALLAPAVSRELRALDPDVAAASIRPMEEAIDDSLAERRFQTVLLELFGAAALLLALAGIYAVTAFSVVERTREIGVRLSLGSTRRAILGLIARQSLVPVGAGLAVGAAAALALGRLVSGLLYGVASNDAATLVLATTALALFAAAACVVPALRATRIDPVRALRAE